MKLIRITKTMVTDHGINWNDKQRPNMNRERIERIAEVLKKISPRSNINWQDSSYALKHILEPRLGYMTNGEFIYAALHAGLRVEVDEKLKKSKSPNAYFYFTARDLHDVLSG
ncbi:hypothetical protein AWB71_02578 [Caballeronia peredens]|nr:hypothetical protein AWB71_02578 [Caballeronia peredens]